MTSLADRWRSYFGAHCGSDVETVRSSFPETRSVAIDLVDLHGADETLARAVFQRPHEALPEGTVVLSDLVDVAGPVQLLLENNPHLCHVPDVGAHQLYDIVTVQGVVGRVGEHQVSTVTAQYTCPACDTAVETTPVGTERAMPSRCPDCGWDGTFAFQPSASQYIDVQTVALEPLPGHQHRAGRSSLRVSLAGDLVDAVTEDGHVGVTGILHADHDGERPRSSVFLEGFHVRDERNLEPPADVVSALDLGWDESIGT